MRWIKAAMALVALCVLVLVPPTLLLLYVGSPWPSGLSWNAQLTNDTLIGLLSVVVWLLWAQTIWCVGVEAVAAARSTSLQRAPGTWPVQQHLARTLVGAIVTAVIALPSLPTIAAAGASTSADTPPLPTTPTVVAAADSPSGSTDEVVRVDDSGNSAAARAETTSVTVVRGDTLWSIAEGHLGDGERWDEIAEANEGRAMSDGRTFHVTDVIRPGWDLVVPTLPVGGSTERIADGKADYTVEPGDTLSQIALAELGDANAWPEVFAASKDLDQPVPLTDPDLIFPGQHIDIPRDSSRDTVPVAEPEPEHEESSSLRGSPRSIEGADGALSGTASRSSIPDSSSNGSDGVVDGSQLPSWVMPGLTGAGALLAGSLLLALRRRRANQHRARRPGRTIAHVDPELTTSEKSIMVAGATTVNTVDLIDDTLCRLADTIDADGTAMPTLAAVEVTSTAIALHLKHSARPPAPWAASDDELVWVVGRDVDPSRISRDPLGRPAPWPMLVTVGHDADDSIWLLNLEDLDIAVTGDAVAGADFARFLAAEIACNPWSKHTDLDLVGIAEEIVPMSPDRIRVHETDAHPASQAVADAVRTIDRLGAYDTETATARSRQVDPDVWPSRLVMVSQPEAGEALNQLLGLLADHRGRTATAVIQCGLEVADYFMIHIDEQRRLTIPAVNLVLQAVGLSVGEAQGCAALLAQANDLDDAPVPDLAADDGWHAMATAAGALRDEYRLPRSSQPMEPSSSLLEGEDSAYTAVAATTAEDLDVLAPKVTAGVREQVGVLDPTLDADLEAWLSDRCDRPRLTLLGPVGARTSGMPLDRRKPYYTELFAYLATRAHGATNDEVATAFDITPGRVRTDVNKLRKWLGSNPATDERFVPDALSAAAAAARGIGVYRIVEPLVDVDLFRRLRLRGESRGSDGVSDLVKALQLVQGRPFEKLRPGGWGWLFEGDRLDQHLTCAIADVAHIVVTYGLKTGELKVARGAVEVAMISAPDEEVTLLDLAAVLEAEGHHGEAERILREDVCNRSQDGNAPTELTPRSEQIIDARRWLKQGAM